MYCTQYLYWICNQIIIIIDNNFYHDSVTWSHYILSFFRVLFIYMQPTFSFPTIIIVQGSQMTRSGCTTVIKDRE